MNMNFHPEAATPKSGKIRSRFGLPLVALTMALGGIPLGGAVDAQTFGAKRQVASKSIQHDGQSFAVVPASEASMLNFGEALATASSQNEPGSIDLIGFQSQLLGCDENGCDDKACGDQACGGGSCNSGACGTGRGGRGAFAGFGSGAGSGNGYGGGGLACPTCDPYCYVRAEALYMRRNGLDNFTRSRNFRLGEHDFEIGPRITIGRVPDCVNGTEFTFTGPLEWTTTSTALNQTGQTTLFELIPANALTAVPVSQTIGFTFLYDPEEFVGDPPVFTDFPTDLVDIQRQRYESRYMSAEINRTMMDWDIVKFLYGGRYINFEEEFSYTAVNTEPVDVNDSPAGTGRLLAETRNNLVGLQVGLDIYNPVCRNTSSFTRARGGLFYNFAEGTVLVDDQNQRLYGASDDQSDFAFMFEINSGIEYRLGEMLSIHAGGELWYIAEVATAENQIPLLVGARAASQGISAGDDVTFVGFNFGATLKF